MCDSQIPSLRIRPVCNFLVSNTVTEAVNSAKLDLATTMAGLDISLLVGSVVESIESEESSRLILHWGNAN